MQHIPHLRMPSSVVQRVLNLGTRMAAAISSGSASISSERRSSPARRAFTKGPQYLEVVWRLWSLDLSSVMVGTSQPSCTLASPWRRLTALQLGSWSLRILWEMQSRQEWTWETHRHAQNHQCLGSQTCLHGTTRPTTPKTIQGRQLLLCSLSQVHYGIMPSSTPCLATRWHYKWALQVITHSSVQVEEQQWRENV